MFRELDRKDAVTVMNYIEQHSRETMYFWKHVGTFAEGNCKGTFYGFFEEGLLTSLFYFSVKNAMSVHLATEKSVGNLAVLKAIKHHKPMFIKGNQASVKLIYKILQRTIRHYEDTHVWLMKYEGENPPEKKSLGAVTALSNFDEISEDQYLKFFIEVESHFDRKIRSVNDLAKAAKAIFENKNAIYLVEEGALVAQGLIEEEGKTFGILGGIYVKKDHRNRGYGTYLTDKLTQILIKREKTPFLFVKMDNEIACDIYKALGYKMIDVYTILSIAY